MKSQHLHRNVYRAPSSRRDHLAALERLAEDHVKRDPLAKARASWQAERLEELRVTAEVKERLLETDAQRRVRELLGSAEKMQAFMAERGYESLALKDPHGTVTIVQRRRTPA